MDHRIAAAILGLAMIAVGSWCGSAGAQDVERAIGQGYSTCKTWQEVVDRENLRYATIQRVSDPGPKGESVYTGFWFFDGWQFDESGRYALAMKVDFQNREVTPADRGEIGYFDLQNNNQWTKIGETTARN